MRGSFRSLTALCLGTSALTVVLLGSACLPVSAATTTWTDGIGDWFTAGNWSTGVPSASDTAVISNGGTAQIAAGTATAGTVNITNGSAIALLSGGSLNATNTYVGSSGSVLSSGTFIISSASALGTTTFNLNGTLTATTTATTASNIIFNAGTDSTVSAAAGTTLNLTGNLTFNTSASDGHTVFVGSATETGIVDVSTLTVTVGANPGPLEIVGGKLRDTPAAGASNFTNAAFATALGLLPSVTIDAGATLEIDSSGNARTPSGETLITLQGSGNLLTGGATPRIALGSSTFAGQISGSGYIEIGSDSTTGPGSTVILTGNNNSAPEFQIGTHSVLQVGNGGTTGSLASGGRVVGYNFNGLPGALTTLRYDRSDNVTLDRFLIGDFVLEQAGSGILTVASNNTNGDIVPFSGKVVVSSGGLSISSDNNLNGNSIALANTTTLYTTANGTYTSPVTIAGASTFNVAAGTTATWSGQIGNGTSPGGVNVTGGGTLVLTNANSYSGGTTISGSTLQVGAGGTVGSLGTGTIVVNNNGALIFNRSDTVTVSDAIVTTVPNGSLTQAGSGTLILTGANTYNGGTIISAGTLQIGNGGTTGTAGNSGVTDNSALVFDRSDVFTMGGVINGSGTVTQAGSGTLILNSSNTYSGTTTINSGGTLQVGPGGTNGTLGSGNVVDNGTLNFNHTDNISVSNTVSGSGSLGQIGTGTLTLTGANTYTGGTTISSGSTLQIGSGGASGSITGNVADNGFLIFNRSGAISLGGVISGAGGVIQRGSGTLTLTGVNTYTGSTSVLSGATLALSGSGSVSSASQVFVSGGPNFGGIFDISNTPSGGSIKSLSGDGNVALGSKTLTITGAFTTFSGVISGSGGITIASGTQTISAAGPFAATNDYTGITTINNGAALALNSGAKIASSSQVIDNGTFDISGTTGIAINSLSGNGAVTLGNSPLSLTNAAGTFSGSIGGGGSITLLGGAEILSGTNTYSGGTSIYAGTLQIGTGGSTGSIAGNVNNNATLIFNRSDNIAFAGVISGGGAVIKSGAGSLTLSGIDIYTGPTTVSAGTLSVNGSIANSSVTVASGATLNGTGTVGTTTIQNGGTLAPGNSIGTLTVNGNLALASGAIYNVEVSPIVADRTNVSGTASLNGNVVASVASGTYAFGQRYTLINAAGGVSGSFASLTGIPLSLKGQLSYDTNNAYLTLSPNALAPLLTNPTGNQQKLVSAIDAAVAAGNVPPGGFVALYGLSGSALNGALDQISGQAAPNVINAVGNSFLSFMSMTAAGGGGNTGDFAPGSAYGKADAPHRAQLGAGEMRVWGAAYGGHVGLSGDTTSGAASLSSNNVGMIGGADMKVADGVLAGVTLGLGRQLFHSGNGSGESSDFMFGLYGRAEADAAYVTASFGFGWHQIKTLRVITVSGTDVLQGKQNADDFGGRVETGWHLPLDDAYTVTPYGAFAGESFESPAYAETALSGASTFALSYAAQTTTLGRTELGAHLDRNYALEQGRLTADVRAAWAHQLDDLPFTQASFQGLPGAAFQVAGVRPDRDTALLGLDLDVQNASGLFFGVHGEGQFGAGTTVVEGLGDFGWRW